MSKILIIVISIIIIGALALNFYQKKSGPISILPTSSTKSENGTKNPEIVTVITTGVEIPWEIAFLPESKKNEPKKILFTERTGKLKLIANGQVTTVAKIPDVKIYGEGGLMGLTIHPDFQKNKYMYLYYTYAANGNETKNRVVRYKYENGNLTDRKVILDNIPGAIYHNGGRIKFGPDGFLYITTGDSLNPSLAQNTNSLAGKILRVTDEGSPATGNPFNNLVYSYGHRNPQGISWDKQGRLWSTEHGRSAPSGFDEVNIIVKGKNYGWPEIQGTETKSGMESPFAQSGQETWAPASAEFINDSFFFAGLKGEALYELRVENSNAIIKKHLLNEFGRIRAVTLGPDNLLYISTSNRDGRGKPVSQDDRIIQIDPSQL